MILRRCCYGIIKVFKTANMAEFITKFNTYCLIRYITFANNMA